MMRAALIAAALLAPAVAWADPATIGFILGASIEIGAIVITVQQLLVVGLYVYGASRARRKARSAQAKARAEYNANLQDRTITALQALPAWRIVLGRAWVGCDIHAIFTTDKTGYREDGTSYTRPDALKHLVVVFADHECHAIHDLAIDGVPLGTLDGNGFVTAGSEFYTADTDSRTATIGGGGSVTVPQAVVTVINAATNSGTGYGESSNWTDVTGSITLSGGNLTINGPAGAVVNYTVDSSVASVRVQKHLGTSTQAVDTYLNSVVPSEWTSTDRLLNKCYCVVTLDLENQRFQGGQLGITADISGRKVYDPRKDSTVAGGSGAHRANDPATWEWTDNAAIAGARDYLQAEWGYANDPADINEAYTITAANASDARLSASVQAKADTVTASASANTITFSADQTYTVGDGVRLSSTGTLPAPLAAATTYYLIKDMGVRAYRLATSVANAYAGTAIDITSAGSGTHTCTWHDYAAYKCSGLIITEGDQKEATLDDLAEAMAGEAVYGAQWELLAGVWTATVMDLGDNDLAGQIEIVQADTPLEQLLNSVRGTYVPAGRATPVEFDNYSNATFVTDDGQEHWADLALPFTDSKVRARNISRILVETGRNGQIIRFPATLRAWPLQRGDRVRVSSTEYGLTLKEYRITDWQDAPTAVVLTLQEDASAAWDIADAASSDATPNTGLPSPWVVQSITLGTLTSGTGVGFYSSSGAWIPRIRVPWSALTGAYLADGSGRIVVRWRAPGSVEWQEIAVQSSETSVHISGFRDGDPVLVEVYAVNGLGQPGPSSFAIHTVTITGNGLIGGGNLLANSSFEVDSDANGVADGWLAFSSGTTGTITNSTQTGWMRGAKAQRVECTGLGTTPGTDRIGCEQALVQLGGLIGRNLVLSVWFSASAQTDMQAQVVWKTSGGSTISSTTATFANTASVDMRRVTSDPMTVPATCTQADVYFWVTPQSGRSAGACTAVWDDAQFEPGAVATGWAPRADELLAGVVGTTHLGANAATEVVSDSSTSLSKSFTASAGFPYRIERFLQISWTNSTGATVDVELSGQITGTRTAGAGSVWLTAASQFGSALTSGDFSSVAADLLHTDATSGERRYTHSNLTSVAAGSTIYFALTAVINTASGTTTDYGGTGNVRIVVIKR